MIKNDDEDIFLIFIKKLEHFKAESDLPLTFFFSFLNQ